ncbi:MAG: response regulator, partial [Verrucomicrobia bacterium]|nr:response regulator [Verrucomicrobiota bacterium]
IYLGLAVVFTLAASLMACLFSLQLRRAIAWPIAHLAETARKISAQGNYKLRARKDSSDELGGLIDVFNEMLEQIQKRDAQLEKARDELELRVQERTRELRQAQQAVMQQERLKALGQMASGIAHDINNALSPIVGFAGLICLNEPELREKSRRHLRHIQTAGEDIAHIVSRLRDFYRARDEEELLLPFCLNKAVEQVVEMTAPRWRTIPRNHGIVIEIKKQFGEDLPLLVGIESEFREVLTNLIINAVDALPEGGLITIKTLARHSKSAHGQPGRVVVEVGDNGIGMDEETRTRCLEPFFSTKGRRGTGLGLSMVYGVMERHEGNIEIDSEVGKGTTIRLTFPVREPRPVGLLEPLDETKCQPLRVVCIDDDPLQRELLKEMLERDGHVVETAASGETGVTVFRSAIGRGEPPDVVITDLGMPHVDGREVARVIKRGAPETAVILLTGWGEFITDEETELSDFDGILTKPPRLGDFRDAFRRIGRARNRRRQGVEAI